MPTLFILWAQLADCRVESFARQFYRFLRFASIESTRIW